MKWYPLFDRNHSTELKEMAVIKRRCELKFDAVCSFSLEKETLPNLFGIFRVFPLGE